MKYRYSTYKIHICSADSLLIEWQLQDLSPDFVRYQQALIKLLKEKSKDLSYLTPSFDALLIKYDSTINSINEKKDEIKKLLRTNLDYKIDDQDVKTFQIPVCYDDFGIDLDEISKHSKLSISEIIDIHTSQIYTLYFIGFLPGFLYLGQVNKQIQVSRKQKPRPKVEQGSVGIAENQTGIYPNASPGGWQIIGRTPLDIFNVDRNPPSPFNPGDQIKFKAIDRNTFDDMKNSNNQEIEMI